ncbi:MAG: hypothetical protein C5B43_00890 [Verrucomicrobia bacterium]|nr:MAG: hypothetical protein C5B43_00890 [Verrucomicrobiota bacterium]
MKKKTVNLLLIILFGIISNIYGIGPYDEIIEELKDFQKKLGFVYGRTVQGTPDEKRKVCEEMESILAVIETKIQAISLPSHCVDDKNNYVCIDIQNIKYKIACFRKSRSEVKNCDEFFKSHESNNVLEGHIGSDEGKLSGLRGLLNMLIAHLNSSNYEVSSEHDTEYDGDED